MILFLGDLHGNFEYLKHLLKSKSITDCYIIQVGDFGAGFTKPVHEMEVFESLNEFLKSRNIKMYAFRGNHDNPAYFNGDYKFSNLELIPDYTVLDIEDEKILCIGGAVSIDRKQRLAEDTLNAKYGSSKRSYWYDEVVKYDEDKIKQISGVNVLATHTAPDWCVPNTKLGYGHLVEHFAYEDEKLIEDLRDERQLMTKIFNELQKNGNNIRTHMYGHFHRSDITMNGMCNHHLLGINELYQLNPYG